MNREFALSATPALARRLLLLQQVSPIDLPRRIIELSQQEIIHDEDFDDIVCPRTPLRSLVTQFLLDSQMRGIVQARYHPELDEITLLNIARVSKHKKISVLTRQSRSWRRCANALFLDNIDILAPYDIDGSWIDDRRDGVLIIDIPENNEDYLLSSYVPFIREFPRLIFYQSLQVNLDQLTHWTALAAALYPTMPHPISLAMRLDKPLKKRSLLDFALFYNVCIFPQYIQSSKLLDSLRD